MKLKVKVSEAITGFKKNGETYKTYIIRSKDLKPFNNKIVEIDINEVI